MYKFFHPIINFKPKIFFVFLLISFISTCKTDSNLIIASREIDQSLFQEIDRHAVSTPSSEESSIPKLAKYLTSTSKNDNEKVRAIFRWMTDRISYDTKSYFSGEKKDQGYENIFKSRVAVCEGYANLFNQLSKEAGIESVKIDGYSKGYSYFPGKKFTNEDHSWNAVRIDGEWRLIDTTWGAGIVKDKEFIKEFNDHYFFTSPEKFVSDHLPTESKWQFLSPPLTIEEFTLKPRKYSTFYKNGFYNLNPDLSILEANDSTEVSIENNLNVQIIANLDNKSQYVFIKKDGKKITFEIRAPGSGEYSLKIFSKKPDDTGSFPIILEQKIKFQKQNYNGIFADILDFNKSSITYPKDGILKSKIPIAFSMTVPNASEIAFVDSSKEWKKFSPKSGNNFSGEVILDEGDVNVYANIGISSWPLLIKYKAVK